MRRVLGSWRVMVAGGIVMLGLGVGLASSSAQSSSPARVAALAAKAKPVVYVYGVGVETSPALGALFPSFTEATTEPEAAAKAINGAASSKVRIDYTFCDTKAEASVSVTCAQQAASPTACNGHRCDVAIEAGDPNDNLTVPLLAKEGIPTVNIEEATPQAADTKGDFCINSGSNATYAGLGYVIKKLGATKVGILGVIRPDATLAQNLMIKGAERQGLSVTGSQIIAQTTTSFDAPISSVMIGQANGLIDAVVGPTGTALEYVAQTYPGAKVALPLITAAQIFFGGAPASVVNGVGVSALSEPTTATSVPGIKKWIAEGGVTATSSGPAWTHFDFSVLAWLAVHFIANVADTTTGSITPASMMHAFKTANNVNMYGIVPPWSAKNLGKKGAIPCSPYNEIVADTVDGQGVLHADNPGVFVNAFTGKVEYVDAGFKK